MSGKENKQKTRTLLGLQQVLVPRPPPHRVPQAPQDTPTLPGQDTQALQGTQEKQRRLIFSEKQVRMFSSERVLCASCEPVSWQVDVTRQRRGEGQVY